MVVLGDGCVSNAVKIVNDVAGESCVPNAVTNSFGLAGNSPHCDGRILGARAFCPGATVAASIATSSTQNDLFEAVGGSSAGAQIGDPSVTQPFLLVRTPGASVRDWVGSKSAGNVSLSDGCSSEAEAPCSDAAGAAPKTTGFKQAELVDTNGDAFVEIDGELDEEVDNTQMVAIKVIENGEDAEKVAGKVIVGDADMVAEKLIDNQRGFFWL